MIATYHPCFLGACRGTVRVVDNRSPIGAICRVTRKHDGVLVAGAVWLCDLCRHLHAGIASATLAITTTEAA